MDILIIGGNHPRHLYYINKISNSHSVNGCILQKRENIIPSLPLNIPEQDQNNFQKHFDRRYEAEKKYFGDQSYPDCKTFETTPDELNSLKTIEFVKSINPEIVLLFGCGLIKDQLRDVLPFYSVNLHGGLSPWYKGVATLFWPFYFLEPTYAGSTFHIISPEADAGDIIHQTCPKLELNDGIHDVGCKTIIESTKHMSKLLEIFEKNKQWTMHKQNGVCRTFRTKDFRPEHLRVIYDLFNDDIVKYYLEGRIHANSPNLITQF